MKIKHLLLFIILLGIIYLGYHSFTEKVFDNNNPTFFEALAGLITILSVVVLFIGLTPLITFLNDKYKIFKKIEKILNTNLTLKR